MVICNNITGYTSIITSFLKVYTYKRAQQQINNFCCVGTQEKVSGYRRKHYCSDFDKSGYREVLSYSNEPEPNVFGFNRMAVSLCFFAFGQLLNAALFSCLRCVFWELKCFILLR